MTMLAKLYMDCQFKEVGDEMTFTAYGNVKNVVDHVRDVAVDGCYSQSIAKQREKNRFARLLWGHDQRSLPVGKIHNMEEDSHGLLFAGKLSKTTMGKDLYILAKDDAVDSFSIGYTVQDEEYDPNKDINYLKQIDIKEISFVNFACNEDSVLVDMKSHIAKGLLPTKREIESMLRKQGFSRKESTIIASYYKADGKMREELDIEAIKSHAFFN